MSVYSATDGALIHYDDSAGPGRTIVLLHVLLGDRHLWDKIVPLLTPHYRVISIEARGHGESTAADAADSLINFDTHAADCTGVLEHAKITGSVLICGLSMGGMTAMRLAYTRPDRVAGMVLLSTNADAETWWKRRIEYGILKSVYSRRGITWVIKGPIAKVMFGKPARKKQRQLVREFMDRAVKHAEDLTKRDCMVRAIEGVIERPSIVSRLGEIKCPVLILTGENDKTARPKFSKVILNGIGRDRATLEKLPGTGHLSAMEQPELVGAKILKFARAKHSGI